MVSQGCTLICFFQDACRATVNTWPPDNFKTVVFNWPPAREVRTYCCGSHVPSLTPEHPISRTSVKDLVSSINTVSHYNSDLFYCSATTNNTIILYIPLSSLLTTLCHLRVLFICNFSFSRTPVHVFCHTFSSALILLFRSRLSYWKA